MKNARDRLTEAWARYEARDQTAAARLFLELRTDPDVGADATYGLGLVALNGGSLGQAAALFKDALTTNPTHANALFQLGAIAEKEGRPEDARSWYARTLEVSPNHAGALSRGPAVGLAAGRTSSPPPSPRPSLEAGAVAGVVRNLQQRPQFWNQRSVWTFEVVPEDGTSPVVVEMRGLSFLGAIANGDRVAVKGRRVAGVLRTRRVENLSNGSVLRVRSYRWVMAVGLVVWLGFMAFLFFGIGGGSGLDEFRRESEQLQQEFIEESEQRQQEFLEGSQEGADTFDSEAREQCVATLGEAECDALFGSP